MPSTRKPTAPAVHTFALLSLFTASALSIEHMSHQRLHQREDPVYVACYSSAGSLEEANTWPWQSQGYCSQHCDGGVIGLTAGNTCYCGNEIPSDSDKVDDSKCDTTCVGWPSVNCGGDGFYSVWTTGKGTDVATAPDDTSSSSSSSSTSNSGKNNPPSSAPPTIVTSQVAGGSTIVVTVPATSDPTADAQKSGGGGGGGSNTAGIAAGVVVGVVALAGVIAGVYFFLRHRKQKQAEEDFKQRTQVADFMRGSNERKPPGSAYSGTSDSRLDPEAGRRNSVGSLADNQDYTRRILRVANPDNS